METSSLHVLDSAHEEKENLPPVNAKDGARSAEVGNHEAIHEVAALPKKIHSADLMTEETSSNLKMRSPSGLTTDADITLDTAHDTLPRDAVKTPVGETEEE